MNVISVTITPLVGQQLYDPRYLSITHEHVIGCGNSRKLGFLLGYCSREQFEERVIPIREAMDKYNHIVCTLWETPGFKEFFAEHNSVVSRESISRQFGEELASLAFSLRSPPGCYPDLVVFGGLFQLSRAGYQGSFVFNGVEYAFDIDGLAISYPNKVDGKICFWNWDSNNTDYAFGFAKYVEENLPKGVSVYTDSLEQFDYYDQCRGGITPVVEAINEIFSSMEQRDYLTRYELMPDNYQSVWNYYTGMASGAVGLYLCDPKAFRDKLLIARINALLKACSMECDDNGNPVPEQVELLQKHYYLQDSNDQTYLSKNPGQFGGHYKLKIYGRLDCPSAARYLAKGQYVRYRVFFENEDTAIAAGYRPCGVCMKEAYKKWKSGQQS